MENLVDNGSERALLSGLVQYGLEAYVEISDVVSEASFGSLNNQIIYRCLKHIIEQDQTVDVPSILSASEKLGLSETIQTDQELNYIKSLFEFYVEKGNMFNFAMQVKKLEYGRNIIDTCNKIKEQAESINGLESIEDIINIIERPVADFVKEDSTGDKPELIGDGLFEHLEFLKENQCDAVGIPTGFPYYDEGIGGGLRRKSVNIVAARPKTGKSLFGMNAGINIAEKGTPVIFLDTEMDKDTSTHRMLAAVSGVKIRDIETGKFYDCPEKTEKVLGAAKKIKEIPFHYINISGKSFPSICNIIKRWAMQSVGKDENGNTNDCVVVYDYLKLMDSSSIGPSMQEYQVLGFQITELHNLMVKLDTPCLTFVQLNRDGISKESTDAISGSDRLVWLCTSLAFFKAKSEEEIAEDGVKNGNRKMIILAARYGGGLNPGDYINMNMIGDCSQLIELGTRNQSKTKSVNDTGLVNEEDLEDLDFNDDRFDEAERTNL